MRLVVLCLALLIPAVAIAADAPPAPDAAPQLDAGSSLDETSSPDGGSAAPAELPNPESDRFVEDAIGAAPGIFARRDFRAGAALAVMLLVFLARRYGARIWPWLASSKGGRALAFACAFLACAGTALAAGSLRSLGWVPDALLLAISAMGGHALAKDMKRKPAES